MTSPNLAAKRDESTPDDEVAAARSHAEYLAGFDDADGLDAFLDAGEANDRGDDQGSPVAIIRAWQESPRLPIVSTGIVPLDDLCSGGLPVPRRVIIVGAPAGSKTGLAVWMGDSLERAGLVVGFLAVDEESEDILMRLAQMAGFDRGRLQAREAFELDQAEHDFTGTRFRFYAADCTLEDAATDVAERAAKLGTQGVLIVDSIQTVMCKANRGRTNAPREYVEANVAAFRKATTEHRLLGIATSEANRASYSENASGRNPMASGAETRSIEFAAQTLIFVAADETVPNVFKAQVVKNRAFQLGEFSLRMDPASHTYEPISRGTLGFERKVKRDADKAARASERAATDAIDVARVLNREPGITTNRLHAALRREHTTFDENRASRGLEALGDAVEVRPGANNSREHYLDVHRLPKEVAKAL
jgi:hypothetical protein